MISFKDVKEAGDEIQIFLLSLVLMPLWYISLHLFARNFFKENDLILIGCYCFGLSAVSVIIVSISLLFHIVADNDKLIPLFGSIKFSVIALFFWLSLDIFIFYSVKIFTNQTIPFYSFLISYFFPVIGFTTSSFIRVRKFLKK